MAKKKLTPEQFVELLKQYFIRNSSSYFAIKYYCEENGYSINDLGFKDPVREY